MPYLSAGQLAPKIDALISKLEREQVTSFQLAGAALDVHHQKTLALNSLQLFSPRDKLPRAAITREVFKNWIQSSDSSAYREYLQHAVRVDFLLCYLQTTQYILQSDLAKNSVRVYWEDRDGVFVKNIQRLHVVNEDLLWMNGKLENEQLKSYQLRQVWSRSLAYSSYIMIPLLLEIVMSPDFDVASDDSAEPFLLAMVFVIVVAVRLKLAMLNRTPPPEREPNFQLLASMQKDALLKDSLIAQEQLLINVIYDRKELLRQHDGTVQAPFSTWQFRRDMRMRLDGLNPVLVAEQLYTKEVAHAMSSHSLFAMTEDAASTSDLTRAVCLK